MARKRGVRADGRHGDPAAGPQTVKVTLRLSLETAQRLGVEASMRRITQSRVAEEVLGPYLKRWRLPSTVEAQPLDTARREESDGHAA